MLIKRLKAVSLLIVMAAGIFFVNTSDEPLEAYQKRPMPPLDMKAMNGSDLSTAKWAIETDGPKIINLFASWCTPCIQELPELEILNDSVPVYGIAFRDDAATLKTWLAKHGNPFTEIGIDNGIIFTWDLGISAVPTTLLLDASNKIIYMKKGVVTRADIDDVILPLIKDLK